MFFYGTSPSMNVLEIWTHMADCAANTVALLERELERKVLNLPTFSLSHTHAANHSLKFTHSFKRVVFSESQKKFEALKRQMC